MWSRRARRSTLAGQLLLLQLAVVFVVLGIVAAISLRQSTASFADERGSQMRSVAEYLANVAVVRSQADEPDAARALAPAIDRALRLSGATTVSIAAPDGTIVSSSDPGDVGRPAVLEESRVQEGRGWSGDVSVDGERYVAAHAPVLDDDGRLVGLSIAEQRYPSTWERLTDAASDLALFLGVGAALGVAGSYLVSRIVRRRTRGLGTREIATLADHREALLHSIREGVVAVSGDGRVTLLNDGARALLGLGEDAVGRPVGALGLDPDVVQLLTGETETRDAVALVRGRVLVLNHRPASSRGEGIGSVTTMRDRTEVVAVQSQLQPLDHRHAARPDPRVRQPAAHHLRPRAARRVRRGAHARRHDQPAAGPGPRRRPRPARRPPPRGAAPPPAPPPPPGPGGAPPRRGPPAAPAPPAWTRPT